MHYGINLFAHQLSDHVGGLRKAASALDEGFRIGKLKAEGDLPKIIAALQESAELLDQLLTEMLMMDDHRPCSLLAAIKQSERLYGANLARHGIEMTIKVDEGLIVDVPFYITSFAIANLVSNASNAVVTAGGNSKIIHIEAEESGENILCFVTDNGPGVASEIIERLKSSLSAETNFNELVTTKDGRHGRGLMLVRESLCVYGAYVELTKPGPSGTMFTIGLPKKR